MGSGNLNLVAGRNAAAGHQKHKVGDKLKKEWRKVRKGEGKTENLGIEKKRKGWFSRWRYGRSRCRLC
jgi:hypothetical protein